MTTPGLQDPYTAPHFATPALITIDVQRDLLSEAPRGVPDWYEEMHERRRKAHSSRRIRVEHGIAHLKNWRSLARHLGRRKHMSDTVQAIAGLLSHRDLRALDNENRLQLTSEGDPVHRQCTERQTAMRNQAHNIARWW